MKRSQVFLRRHPALVLGGFVTLVAGPILMASGFADVAVLTNTCVHLLRFCLAALVEYDPILHGIPLLLIVLGIVHGVKRRIPAVRRGTRFILGIPTCAPLASGHISELARRYELEGKVRVMSVSTLVPACTAGLLRPRIYLSQQLETALSQCELEAVFLHERHHLRNYDPMRSLATRMVADALFWIPLVGSVLDDLVAQLEFAADDAARVVGDTVLASAIIKVAELTPAEVGGANGFASPSLVERRVERLLDEEMEGMAAPQPRTMICSIGAVAMIWMLGVASSAAHASHLPESQGHCPHHHHMGVFHAVGGRSAVDR